MTKLEREILGPTIKALVAHDPLLWWELKREIYGWGWQAHYPREYEYTRPAERAILRLQEHEKARLHQQWPIWNKRHTERTDETLVEIYTPVVVEEIVRRAEVASRRTENW